MHDYGFYSAFQVERLRKEIDMQNKKKDGLGARAYVAEKKIHQLNSKLEKVMPVRTFLDAFLSCYTVKCLTCI